MKPHIRKLKSLKNKVDCILLLPNDPNLFYFTNTYSGVLIYDFSKPLMIATSFDYLETKKSKINTKIINPSKYIQEILKQTYGIVGINKNTLPAALYEKIKAKVKTKDIGNELEEIRMIKEPYEIGLIKKSCKITKKIFHDLELKPSITENKIAGLIESRAREFNAKAEVNVAFSTNTSEPHHRPTEKRFGKGPAWIDLCVCHKGYYSDVTRTYNHPLKERLEKIVSELEIKPGVRAGSLEKRVRKKLGKDEKYFTHSLGHGVGVAIHERPFISKNSKDSLKQNMVFTIEPGVYKKTGIRIEDVFLITKKGNANLTKSVI